MAKMIPPSFPDDKRKDLGAERAVYYALKKQLDDDYTVLWSISTLGANVRQLDFLVLHPQFGLVVIEVKGGQVTLGNPMDPHRKWTAATRAGVSVKPIDNPYQQALGAGMAFIADWKANSSFNRFAAVTPLVILPHTPRPSNADAVLAPKADHFLFENDMAMIGLRVAELMKTGLTSGKGLEEADIESIIKLYGRQHVVPEPQVTAQQPSPQRRPAGIRIFGLALAAGVSVVLAFTFAPGLFSAATRPTLTAVTGTPEVLDTATLSLNGQRLPLAGLRAVNLPEAEIAARYYLAQAGEVTCELAPVGGWRCTSVAKRLDIAEVFALSGFAKAATNAPELIRNAEGMARQNGKGVWGPS